MTQLQQNRVVAGRRSKLVYCALLTFLQFSYCQGNLQTKSSLALAPKLTIFLKMRGGQSSSPDPYSSNYANYNSQATPDYGDNHGNYEDGFANYNPPPGDDEAAHLFQETVQERVDKWRQSQMTNSQNMTPEQVSNPRDEQGRMKLLAQVSKGSRAFIFFVLMWRDVHFFEIADHAFSKKGALRLMAIVPLTILFIANLAGVVASITSPSHSTKKRMKAILNLDKLIEAVMLVWYFIRLTVAPSKFVPREIFIANTLHSVFFLIQCQAFTRVTWDEIKPGSSGTAGQGQASVQPVAQQRHVVGEDEQYAGMIQHPDPAYVDSQYNQNR